MPQKSDSSDVAIFCLVMGGFVLTVLVALAVEPADKAIGVVLLGVGTLALVGGRAVASVKAVIGERLPLWPEKNTVRPFTVRLWGGCVFLLGLMMVLGM